jgi:peptidoglycan hydrolase CwlO-like protein
MTPITQQGVFCVVQAGEVERKTREGWQLVGVIDAEQATLMSESSVVQSSIPTMGGANYQVNGIALPTTRSHVVQTPMFLLCQSADSALGQLGLQLENAVRTCTEALDRAKQAQTEEAKATKMMDALNNEAVELKRRLDLLDASNTQLIQERYDMQQSLRDRDAQIEILQTKLGKRAQPTAFERLMEPGGDDDEESSLTSE